MRKVHSLDEFNYFFQYTCLKKDVDDLKLFIVSENCVDSLATHGSSAEAMEISHANPRLKMMGPSQKSTTITCMTHTVPGHASSHGGDRYNIRL